MIFCTWNVLKNLDKVDAGSNFEILSFFKKSIYFLKKIRVSSPLYLGLRHFMPSLVLNDDAETNKPAAPFTPIWALRPTWVLTPYARVRTYFFSVAADEKNKEDAHQRVFLCELRTNKLGLSKKTLLCLDTRCKRVWRRIAIGLSLFSYCTLASIWLSTGKSLSEALILASTNPQFDDRLFIELRVQYRKNPSSEPVCVHKLFWMSKQKTIFVHNMFWACNFHVLNT